MKLQKSDYIDAVTKSLENAGELIEEASILRKHSKFSRAYSLYQLSIEEIGKASMAFSFVLYNDITNELECKKFLKDFRDHKTKTKSSLGIDLIYLMNSEKDILNKKLLTNFLDKIEKPNIEIANDLKNYSLYTSYVKDKFYLPSEIITEKQVNEIEFSANMRLKVAKSFFTIGIENFETLYQTRNQLDVKSTLEEGVQKMKEILDIE